MMNTWKGGLTSKNFFRVINCILLVAALLAVAFCAYFVYSAMTFPAERYNTQIAELNAQTEQIREETAVAREDAEQRVAYLRADIRNNGSEAAALADRIDEMKAAQSEKLKKLEELQAEVGLSEDMPAAVETARKEYALAIRELEEKIQRDETAVRICYWTLNGGPSDVTEDFLNMLEELGEHVHVSFFTAKEANSAEDAEQLIRQEMERGHSVQNLTYSGSADSDGPVYGSLDSFREQVLAQDEWIYEATGFHPTIFRFPGGFALSQELLPEAPDLIGELGYEWVDWNCNLNDSGAPGSLPTSGVVATRALTQIPEVPIAVVVGHDWNENTLEAMKTSIPMLRQQGYVFLPLFPESVTMGMVSDS